MKKVSLDFIAQELGVSKTLVSLVLNGRGDDNGISKATQKRVLELAQKLNYKPNLMARGLRTGKSNIIGLIVADIANPFYAKIARRIEDNANKLGYDLIICSSDEKVEKEAKLIKMLRDRQIDGLIISSTQDPKSETINLIHEKFPVVLIDRYIPEIEANEVIVDNYDAAYNAMQHLIDQGFDKTALLTISPSYNTSLKDRFSGYKKALEDQNIPFNDAFVYEIPFKDIKKGVADAVKHFIQNGANAIFSMNNSLTTAIIEYFHKHHIAIPDHMGLMGFDDLELFKYHNPPISTIWQPLDEICKNAVKLLIEDIKSINKTKTRIELKTKMLIRKSSQIIHA